MVEGERLRVTGRTTGVRLPGPGECEAPSPSVSVAVTKHSLALTQELQPVSRVGPARPQPELVDLQARHLERKVSGQERSGQVN